MHSTMDILTQLTRLEVHGQHGCGLGSYAQRRALQLVSDSAPGRPEDLASRARAREPEYLVHSFRLDREDSARGPSK